MLTNTSDGHARTVNFISFALPPRPGKPVNISFKVGLAENFPVDLYFLMDLSWSMRSSRDNLISVTEEIIKAIKLKTDDVNIGNIVVLPATDDVGDMRPLEELHKPRVSVKGATG